MKNIIKSCGLAAAVVALSACATVTRGTSQKYEIMTTPTAANVKLSTGQTCVSPCNLKLKRKNGFVVTASKEGYQNATATVEAKVRGGGAAGAAGNILLGGVIGIAVDATNGSMNDLTPNPLHMELRPLTAVSAVESAPIAATDPVVTVEPAVAAVDASQVAAPAPGGE